MNPITVSNVSKSFKTRGLEVKALSNVSLEVKEGEIFGLLGPNGAGKTTLINVIINLLTPDEGKVTIFGQTPGPNILKQINVIAGGSQFHWAMTPNDILNFFANIYNIPNKKERISELAKLLKIEHLMDRKTSWFSTGERLRVAFAKALLNKPKLLLMDEPTLGLDPDAARNVRDEVKRLNKEEGMAILLTSHYMHEVEQLCDRIAFIYNGRIVDVGNVKEVKLKHFATYDVILTLDKKPAATFVKENKLEAKGNRVRATLNNEDAMSTLIAKAHEAGYLIKDIAIKKPTLEDYFIKVLGEHEP